ncbi:condensation domain-containing protein [Micromonospora sp. FIMYZ51]|uniref:condensation domain-containing protein n=1 Tax=Micromonospora sp. FIMYZ51 TaxID=3051832 RepID=UPI00311D3145
MTQASPVEAIFPLTPLQEAMLLESLDAGDARAYLSQVRYTLDGDLDTDALAEAWTAAAAKHEALRACVAYTGLTQAVEAVYREPRELFAVAEGVFDDDALDTWLTADLDAGFDLERAPLHRVRVLRRADGGWEMVWTSHHIMIDGWSIPIVISDVFVGYGLRRAGRPIELTPAPSYRAYVAWAAGRDPASALAHWRRALRGFREPTPLPAPLPGTARAGRGMIEATLTPAESAALTARAKRERVTLNTLAQAAWAVVLARFAGRDDVLFGATVSGRPATLPGAETMVGLFINTLPVRVRIAGRVPVTTWLQDLQRRFLAGREFEEMSLRDIRAACAVPRDQGLFHSIVVVENYPLITDSRFSDRQPPLGVRAATSREELAHPLVLSVTSGDRVTVELFHDHARVAPIAAGAMLDGFLAVLRRLAGDPDTTVPELLDAVPAAPPLAIPSGVDGSPVLVPVAVRAVAAASPHAVAVVDGTRRLTYGELVAAAETGAARLREHGAGPGRAVALIAERSADRVVAMLAVWFAGSQFIALDPAWPAARVTALLESTAPALVVSDDGDITTASLSAGPPGDDAAPVSPAEAAYTIFTSGTSGQPKPVVVPHGALAAAVAGWEAAHDFAGRTERHLHLQNPAFDVAIAEVLRALCAGRTLVIAARAVGDDPAALLDLLLDEEIDVVDLPPSLLRPLLDEAELSGQRLDQLSTVLVGGEAWHAADYLRLTQLTGAATRVINAYGITETGIDNAYAVLRGVGRTDPLWLDSTYPGTEAFLVDGRGRPVPRGARGEVWLAGRTLARGYDGDPARTAIRFVPDERPGQRGGRAYRTGDAGTIDDRGRLFLLGRLDAQLSVNGHRIEPQEVEAVLRSHPQVTGAAVTVRDGRLVAFVTGDADGDVLRRHAAAVLPSYAVPAVARIDVLPVTANGKLDRAALPQWTGPQPTGHVAAATPTEQALVEVWEEVLGVTGIGVRDNFFDLGGDSIAGLRVKGRAAGRGIDLQPRDVFSHQTIAELAAHVDAAAPTPQAEHAASGTNIPLLPVQRIFLDEAGADPAHYDMVQGIQLDRELDPSTLREALIAVARRHGALRLRFDRTSTGWQQWLTGEPQVTFRLIDQRAEPRPHDDVVAGLRACADLATAPPWSGTMVLDPGRTTLYLAVHHLVMDIYSWRIIVEDLLRAYAGQLDGEPSPGYPEYALAAAAETARIRDLASDWLAVVGTPRPVPVTGEGPNTLGGVRSSTASASREATARLHRLRAPGATASPVLTTLLAALSRAYGRWTGEDLYLFVESHGRDGSFGGVDVSATVGWFTALYPVTVRYRPEISYAGVWQEVRRLLEAVPQPVSSFGLLHRSAELTGAPSALTGLALPQIAFNHTGTMSADTAARDGLTVLPVPALTADPSTGRDQLIDIESGIADGRLEFAVNYSSAHFDQGSIEKFAALFVDELENLPDDIEEEDSHGAV